MESSLKKRYLSKLIANAISGSLGLFIIALVPKALGPVFYGYFTYMQTFFISVFSFTDLGTSTAFFTKLSAKPDKYKIISFYGVISLSIFLLVFVSTSFLVMINKTEYFLPQIPRNIVIFGMLFGFLSWFSQILIKISDAYALTISVESIKVIHKLISLALIYILVKQTDFNLDTYFFFHYFSIILFIFALSILFYKRGIFKKELLTLDFNFKTYFQEFRLYCTPLVVYTIFSSFVGMFDSWLLQKTAGSAHTGYYGIAFSMVSMSFLFSGAMTPLITREFSKAFEEQNLNKMKEIFSRYIPMLYSVAAFFAVFISFQGDLILNIFGGDEYKNAVPVLTILAFYPIHQTYGQLSGSIFYATEQTTLYKNIGIICHTIGLMLSLILVYAMKLNSMGLALKMVLGQIIGVNLQLYYNTKFLNLKISKFIWHQVYSIAAFSLANIVIRKFYFSDSVMAQLLVSGVVYILYSCAILVLFPQVFGIEKNMLMQTFKKLKVKLFRSS